MITITGPAITIALIVGYFGINAIINGVSSLFKEKKSEEDKDKRD